MASYMNAADIVSTAVEIEKRGYAFYKEVAKNAKDKKDQEFFEYLAGEEIKHKELFASMLDRLGGTDIPAGASDDEYMQYVRDLIDSHCLFTQDTKEMALRNPFMQAIQFEKDTLIFFQAMEGLVPDSEKKAVRACADEEREHLRILMKRMKESLK